MAGRDNRGRQKGMVAFGLVIIALARQAIGAGKLLRAKILRAIQSHQNAPAQPLKALQPAALAQYVNGGVKTGLQMRRIYRIKHGADVIVGRNFRHPEQSPAVRTLAPFLKPALIGQKRFRLHEKQRKRRQADVSHRIGCSPALPFVGKAGADLSQTSQKPVQNVHQQLESDFPRFGNPSNPRI
jgi:hypothetical protein